jgi:DNA-binding NarL/FixJ family response regulator
MSHVMLVENHACFRQALGMVLRQYTDFGISTQAGSLAEGFACLSVDKAEQIDAAIIDIRLPDGNGADLIGEIGALRTAARSIPMMVLTAIQDPELHDRWRDLGAVEVGSKAASLEDILAAAKRLGRNLGRQTEAVREDQRVYDMVNRDLSRREMLPLVGSSEGM